MVSLLIAYERSLKGRVVSNPALVALVSRYCTVPALLTVLYSFGHYRNLVLRVSTVHRSYSES